jgi:hypothetical protein
MGKDFYYSEDCSFFYQIGSIKTNKPWLRPSFGSVKNFLSNSSVKSILDKYELCYLYGSFIWKDIPTWDLDLGLKRNISNIDWNDVENDFNKLNYISLTEYSLLLDLSLREDEYQMPTRKELEVFNSSREIDQWFYLKPDNKVIKISYYHKKSCDDEIIFDFRKSSHMFHLTTSLTNNHLVLLDYSNLQHPDKVIRRILNAKKEFIKPKLDISTFLGLSESEFEDIKNY